MLYDLSPRGFQMALTSSYSPSQQKPGSRRSIRPLIGSVLIAVLASASITYLLWPTWQSYGSIEPDNLPVSVGDTIFNVPARAVRVKLQKRTGPQERVDLGFLYPSLEPPLAPAHVTAETVGDTMRPIDRIFLSIAAHHDTMAPDERVRTIYPRYLDAVTSNINDGLTLRTFRDNTPYANEDLVYAGEPWIVARCSRDATVPGTCLTERRIEGADLTFRFPRAWLIQWRDVATAMDQLITNIHPQN